MCFEVFIELPACLELEVTAIEGALLGAGTGVCKQVGLQVVNGCELLVALLTLPDTQHTTLVRGSRDF